MRSGINDGSLFDPIRQTAATFTALGGSSAVQMYQKHEELQRVVSLWSSEQGQLRGLEGWNSQR